MGNGSPLYCRVSTADQSCARQERDLMAFAERCGYEVVGTFKEIGSGVKLDRAERRKVMALAQARHIDDPRDGALQMGAQHYGFTCDVE